MGGIFSKETTEEGSTEINFDQLCLDVINKLTEEKIINENGEIISEDALNITTLNAFEVVEETYNINSNSDEEITEKTDTTSGDTDFSCGTCAKNIVKNNAIKVITNVINEVCGDIISKDAKLILITLIIEGLKKITGAITGNTEEEDNTEQEIQQVETIKKSGKNKKHTDNLTIDPNTKLYDLNYTKYFESQYGKLSQNTQNIILRFDNIKNDPNKINTVFSTNLQGFQNYIIDTQQNMHLKYLQQGGLNQATEEDYNKFLKYAKYVIFSKNIIEKSAFNSDLKNTQKHFPVEYYSTQVKAKITELGNKHKIPEDLQNQLKNKVNELTAIIEECINDNKSLINQTPIQNSNTKNIDNIAFIEELFKYIDALETIRTNNTNWVAIKDTFKINIQGYILENQNAKNTIQQQEQINTEQYQIDTNTQEEQIKHGGKYVLHTDQKQQQYLTTESDFQQEKFNQYFKSHPSYHQQSIQGSTSSYEPRQFTSQQQEQIKRATKNLNPTFDNQYATNKQYQTEYKPTTPQQQTPYSYEQYMQERQQNQFTNQNQQSPNHRYLPKNQSEQSLNKHFNNQYATNQQYQAEYKPTTQQQQTPYSYEQYMQERQQNQFTNQNQQNPNHRYLPKNQSEQSLNKHFNNQYTTNQQYQTEYKPTNQQYQAEYKPTTQQYQSSYSIYNQYQQQEQIKRAIKNQFKNTNNQSSKPFFDSTNKQKQQLDNSSIAPDDSISQRGHKVPQFQKQDSRSNLSQSIIEQFQQLPPKEQGETLSQIDQIMRTNPYLKDLHDPNKQHDKSNQNQSISKDIKNNPYLKDVDLKDLKEIQQQYQVVEVPTYKQYEHEQQLSGDEQQEIQEDFQ